MRFHVALHERLILHVDGRPALYLGPGIHRVWRPFAEIEPFRFDTRELVAALSPEQLALVPVADAMVVEVGPDERVVVRNRTVPVRWLRPGVHVIWTVDHYERRGADGGRVRLPAITVERFDTAAPLAEPLAEELVRIVPRTEYSEVTVPHGSAGLRFVDGRFDALLEAGRYGAWTTRHKVSFSVVELREQLLTITGQEVMTRDRVTLRLTLSAIYKVVDAVRHATVARGPHEQLYLAIQLQAREAVAGRTLDELLEDRDALGRAIQPQVEAQAQAMGLGIVALGVKDVVLPGDMKALLNRVIEARKQAEASVILRREEVAATRSLAQTAQVLADNPVLMRLKELEAYKELAAHVGKIDVVIAARDGLEGLRIVK